MDGGVSLGGTVLEGAVRPRFRGRLVDLDTSREVPGVRWYDARTGTVEFEDRGTVYLARGRFRVLPPNGPSARKIVMGAEECALCRSPLVLQGDDLCPACRARERGQRHRMVAERMPGPLLLIQCSACTRPAEWAVADEVEVTPQPGGPAFGWGRVLFARGNVVGRRWYCSRCYRPPRLVDARGEVIGDADDEKWRPQW